MNITHPQQQEQEVEEEEGEKEDEKANNEWKFKLSTVISSQSSTSSRAASDTVGVLEFDPSDQLLATGGIARKIRIYNISSLLLGDTTSLRKLDHLTACEYYICTPAKLSSIRWKPNTSGSVIGSGDYDGVVTEYNLEKRVPVFERDEHGGRRIWSVDYSHWVGASGSDDGTTQLWDTRCRGDECVAVVQPSVGRSPVCSVEFDPFGSGLIAMGCADRNAYTYDVRKTDKPVSVFVGHEKTVSYVRFLGEHMMVTAGTDGCLKLWNTVNAHSMRTFKGHVNYRSFVGLSVWRNGGLIGCGSESNEVFVYDKRWSEPIWLGGLEGTLGPESEDKFVSGVCWRQQVKEDECTLVAGGSDGALQVYLGKKKA
ncbi:hypothetical protein C5167_004796 [Papaver somniferum]|uniref:Uncharacterized protein n=1 Tax=Papaver somniferum TaxID=3469 RepID=A0A4Y7JBR2_PAPSO|nr:WD repeat-containing protein RUP2-like [Papaver somniferum]RZC57502.1 hypothetical protein C5167_004796 [Papaver somniferum]